MEGRAAGPDTGRGDRLALGGTRQAFLTEMAAVDAQIARWAASVDFGAALEAAGQPVVADDDGR